MKIDRSVAALIIAVASIAAITVLAALGKITLDANTLISLLAGLSAGFFSGNKLPKRPTSSSAAVPKDNNKG